MQLEQTLQWDDSNPAGVVAGYLVHERIGVDWFTLGRTDQTTFTVTLYRSTATFAVSCYNDEGIESERSEEVTVRWPTEVLPSVKRRDR